MTFKYLIIIGPSEMEVPIIFSKFLQHKQVALNKKVISAGFLHVSSEGKFSCYGKSVSLTKESRGQIDTDLIEVDGNWSL